jgi:cytochrome c biogenesis protein
MNGASKSFEIQGTIGGNSQLTKGAGDQGDKLTLEYTALRVINVENFWRKRGTGVDVRKVDLRESISSRMGAANKTATKKELRNVGPSITYKLRDAAGQAREYHNYMLPVDMGEGVPVFLMGVRDTPAETVQLHASARRRERQSRWICAVYGPHWLTRLPANWLCAATRPKRLIRHGRIWPQQLTASASRALALFAGAEPARNGKPVGGLQAYLRLHRVQRARGRACACRRSSGAHSQWRPV